MSSDKYILITGGSGDIGSAICTKLADKGYIPLIGYARNQEKAEQVAEITKGITVKLDLCDQENIEAVCDEIKERYSSLHGVVLAASPPPTLLPFTKVSSEQMQHHWSANVLGPQLLLSSIIKKVLKPRKSGSVHAILTKAMGTQEDLAMKQMGAYVIGKYGLLGILKLIEAEYSWLDVSYTSPGFTDTKMLEAFDPRFLEIMSAQQSFAKPDDVADDVVSALLKAG